MLCLLFLSLLFLYVHDQGEVGPPGKPGPEGGLGLVGGAGPRGITVQGKMVCNTFRVQFNISDNINNIRVFRFVYNNNATIVLIRVRQE